MFFLHVKFLLDEMYYPWKFFNKLVFYKAFCLCLPSKVRQVLKLSDLKFGLNISIYLKTNFFFFKSYSPVFRKCIRLYGKQKFVTPPPPHFSCIFFLFLIDCSSVIRIHKAKRQKSFLEEIWLIAFPEARFLLLSWSHFSRIKWKVKYTGGVKRSIFVFVDGFKWLY